MIASFSKRLKIIIKSIRDVVSRSSKTKQKKQADEKNKVSKRSKALKAFKSLVNSKLYTFAKIEDYI